MKKKLLLFIFIFFSFIGVSNATRKIDGLEVFNGNLDFTECSLAPGLVGTTPMENFLMSEAIVITVCGANEVIIEETGNELTTTFNNLAGSGVTETQEIVNSDIGGIFIFFVGFLIFIVILGYMYLIIQTKKLDKMKKNLGIGKYRSKKVFMTRKESFKAGNSGYFSRNKKTGKLTYRNFKR